MRTPVGTSTRNAVRQVRDNDSADLYEQLGYVRSGGFRERQDLSQSMEYHFVKLLATAPGRAG